MLLEARLHCWGLDQHPGSIYPQNKKLQMQCSSICSVLFCTCDIATVQSAAAEPKQHLSIILRTTLKFFKKIYFFSLVFNPPPPHTHKKRKKSISFHCSAHTLLISKCWRLAPICSFYTKICKIFLLGSLLFMLSDFWYEIKSWVLKIM